MKKWEWWMKRENNDDEKKKWNRERENEKIMRVMVDEKRREMTMMALSHHSICSLSYFLTFFNATFILCWLVLTCAYGSECVCICVWFRSLITTVYLFYYYYHYSYYSITPCLFLWQSRGRVASFMLGMILCTKFTSQRKRKMSKTRRWWKKEGGAEEDKKGMR